MGLLARRGWLRRTLRYTRRFFLVILGIFLAVAYYVNYVGVPAFVKRRVVAEFVRQGFHAEFSDLKVRRWREVSLENFKLLRADQPLSPTLSGARATLEFDTRAIFGGEAFQNLSLEQGRLEWPIFASGAQASGFVITNIHVELGAIPGENSRMGILKAKSKGIDFEISGAFSRGGTNEGPRPKRSREEMRAAWARWQEQIGSILERVQQFETEQGGRVKLTFDGDLEDLESLRTTLQFTTPLAQTPWGGVQDFRLNAALFAHTNFNELRGRAQMQAASITSGSNEVRALDLVVESSYPLTSNAPLAASALLKISEAASGWLEGTNIAIEVRSQHRAGSPELSHFVDASAGMATARRYSATQPRVTFSGSHAAPPSLNDARQLAEHTLRSLRSLTRLAREWPVVTNAATGQLNITAAEVQTPLGHSGAIQIDAAVAPALTNVAGAESLGFWNQFLRWQAIADVKATDLRYTNVVLETVVAQAIWEPPLLQLTNLNAALFGKKLSAEAQVDVATRKAAARTRFDFDVRQLQHLLPMQAQQWLNEYTWETPPTIEASVSATLPEWDNREPNWQRDVMPTMAINGYLEGGRGGFRGTGIERISSHVTFTNQQWHLPDLTIQRPEGVTQVEFRSDMVSRDFYGKLKGALDPEAIQPALSAEAQKVLSLFRFSKAPVFDAELWGRWDELERVAFRADVFATNFTFREQLARSVKASLAMTNQVLAVRNAYVIGENGWIDAPHVDFHVKDQRIFLTNVIAEIDPRPVAIALGRFAVKALAPYTFHMPPRVLVHGWAPTHDDVPADLTFRAEGGPFSYWKFNVPHIKGLIEWKGDDLTISEVESDFYEGHLQWRGHFRFNPDDSADYSFTASGKNADLKRLMFDLLGKTNQMAGRVDGLLVVTSAHTDDLKTWDGYGSASMTNGFLWDVPLFGFFSPMFDAISDGLGRSQIKSGAATFMMTNSVLHTRDLELRSSAFRLHYDGTIDFDGNVKATVEAELFRDTALIGRLFSFALWPIRKMFEFKITGSINEPKSEPVYIPKLLIAPFRARKIISDLEANSVLGRQRMIERALEEERKKLEEAEEKKSDQGD